MGAPSGSTPKTWVVGANALDRCSNARDQPPASDRHDYSGGVRQIFHDLEADGALTCDDIRIVKRWHVYVTVRLLFGSHALEQGNMIGVQDDLQRHSPGCSPPWSPGQ